MSWTQQDTSFKKLQSKRITTSTGKGINEEKGASTLELYLPDIKTEIIPGTPPGASTSILAYTGGTGQTLVVDTSVSGNLTWFATSGYGNTTVANDGTQSSEEARLMGWVSDKYDAFGTISGAGYEVKLYDVNSNLITKTDPSDWLFDYQTGILTFNNSNTAYGTVAASGPYRIVGYRYIGKKGVITAAYGGLGFTTYNFGDILVGAGTTFIKFPLGTNNYILSASSSSSTGLSWIPNTGGVGAGSQFSIPYYPSAGSAITGSIYFTNTGTGISIAYSTASTNTSTGALVVTGGVGIAGTLNATRIKAASKITFEPGTGTSAVSGWTGIGITSISKMIYAANKFVGVGGSYVAYSSDGVNFTYTTIPGQTSSANYGDIKYGNGIFVAVNVQNVNFTAYSYDGASWGTTSIGSGQIRNVGFGNGRFLAPADAGNIVYSSVDGRNWSAVGGLGGYGNEILFANGYFIAVKSGAICYSKDGVSWKVGNTPGAVGINSVTYGKGIYLAADYNSAQYYTSTDLVTWTQRSIDNRVWTGASYVNGVFYLIPNNSIYLYHSLDGINWSTTDFGTTIGGLNKFFTANDRLYFYSTWNPTLWSTDATTGTLMAKPFYNGELENTRIGAVNPDSATFTHLTAFNDVSFTSATASSTSDNGALTVTGGVGIGGSINIGGRIGIGTNLLSSTFNLLTPTSSTIGVFLQGRSAQSADLINIANSSGIINFSVGANGNVLINLTSASSKGLIIKANASQSVNLLELQNSSSSPLTTFDQLGNLNISSGTASTNTSTGALVVTGGVGIAGTLNVNTANIVRDFNHTPNITTIGGASGWVASTASTFINPSSFRYLNNKYIGIGGTYIYYSDDMLNWSSVNVPNLDSSGIADIAYGEGKYVIIQYFSSNAGYSTNLTNWTIASSLQYNNWFSLAYGNGTFVATSGSSPYAVSSNGINWSNNVSATHGFNTDIKFLNGYFYSSSSGSLERSTDGITWQTCNTPAIPYGITYGNGLYVGGVYNSATVVYSYDGLNFSSYTGSSFVHKRPYFFNGVYYITTQNNVVIRYSTDGFNWLNSTGFPGNVNNMVYAQGKLYVGSGNTVWVTNATPGRFEVNPLRTGNLDDVEIGRLSPNNANFIDVSVNNNLNVSSQYSSTSPFNGALTVAGGVGIGGTLNANSVVTYNRLQNQSFSGASVGSSDGRMGGYGAILGHDRILFGNGTFVTNSSWGAYNAAYSTDGLNWTASALPVNQGYPVNIFGNGYFVLSATGATTVLYSTNGISWSQVSIGNTESRTTGAYGNGKYVIVGSGTTYNYSSNLTSWNSGTLPLTADWRIAYGNGVFVAIGYGTNRLIYSYDAINWNIGNVDSINRNFMKITYTNGKFMVTAWSGGGTWYSYDGINWVVTSNSGGDVNNLSYGNGAYFTNDSLKYTYSSDGFSWSSFVNFSAGYESFQSAYGLNKFITGGRWIDGPTNTVTIDPKFTGEINNVRIGAITPGSGDFTNLSSTGSANLVGTVNANNLNIISKINQTPVLGGFAGTTGWTFQNVLTSPVHALTFGNGLFVSIRRNTNTVNISSNGNRWIPSTMPFSGSWLDLAWGKDKFVAVAGLGTSGAYSGDGISWTSMNMPATAQGWYAVAYGDDKFVAVGNTSTAAYSSDGITWSGSSIANTNWTGIAYGNGTFIAVAGVGQSGAYSYDGINWNFINLPSATGGATTKFITYGNGFFVVTNYVSTAIDYSRDGINWLTSTRSSSFSIHTGLTYGNGIYSILNFDEASFSYDGINWLNSNNIISSGFEAVAYGNNKFVAVSTNTSAVATIDGPSNTLNLHPKFTGDIDNVRIGAKQPAAAEFTNLAAQQPVRFTSNTSSFSINSGALVVVGGVGIGGSVNIGGRVGIGTNLLSSAFNLLTPTSSTIGVFLQGRSSQTADFIDTANSSGIINFSVGANGNVLINLTSASSKGLIIKANASQSVNLLELQNSSSSPLTTFDQLGNLNISSGTASTSTTTGALVVSGGVGIGQSVNIGGKLDVSNTINYTATNSGIANTWTRIAIPAPVSISGLTYGNGLYVGVGYSAATSTDGITWTARSLPHNLTTVRYGNNLYVGVNYGSALGATSTDGVTWRSMSLPSSANWDGIAYGNGIYVITATYNNNLVAYSYNGFQWTLGSLPIPGGLAFFVTTPVIFGGGYFYTGSYSGVYYFTSVDGINWTLRTGLNAVATNTSCYGDGTWLLTGSSGSLAYTKDLTNWTYGGHYGYSGIANLGAYTNGTFAIVDFGSLQCTLIYKNLSTVVLSNLPGPSYATTITDGEGKFVAGAGSTVYVTDVASHTYNIFPHNSGDINNVRIGAKFPAAAQFTVLNATSLVSFGATTPSVSTSTGALVIKGGVGIGGSINIGGRVGIGTNLLTSTFNLLTPTSSTIGAFIQGRSSQTADLIDTANSSGIINFSVGANGNVLINLTSASSKGLIIKANASQSVNLLELQNSASSPLTTFNQLGNLNIYSGTASTSSTTGAIVVLGGVGISGNINSLGRFNFGTLSAPQMSTLSGFGTGGLTPSTTYYYKLSAIDFNNNESLPSIEYSVALSGSQYGTRFYIMGVNGAVGYKLYRTTTSGSYTNSFVQTYRYNQFINSIFSYDIGKTTSTGTPLTTPTGNTATLGSDSTVPSNTLPSLTIPNGTLQVKSPNFTSYAPTTRGVSIETGAYDFIQIREPYGYNNSVSVSTGGTLTAGQTYYYVFTCLDHYGNESLPSQEIAFTADSGGAVIFNFSVATVTQAARRFYRTTTPGNYTNSYIGELSDHKDINYPTKNITPPTATQFAGAKILPAPDFGQYSFIPNIDVAPSGRNGAIRKIGTPYSGTLTLTTSGTAGSLLTNTIYYYKFVEVDIFGGSTYPSQEYFVGTGTSTAVTINTSAGLWIEAKNYTKIYRSTTSNNFSNVPTYIVNSFPFTDVGDTTFAETPPSSSTNITAQLFQNANTQVPTNYLISLAIGPPSNSAPFAILAPQNGLQSVSASTGGTLTLGQVYYYVMSPVDILGFEGVSLQPIRFVATAGGAANITPGTIFGSYGYVYYNLYRSTTLASWSNTLIASAVRGNFIDINYPTRSGAPTFGHHRARAIVYNNSSNLFIPTLVNQTYGQHLTPPSIYRTGGNSSGSLTTNTTYYYRVLPFGGHSQFWGYASDEFAYTTGVNERNITLSIGGHKTGAMGYRVYRSTSFNNFTNAYYFETQHSDFQDLGFSTLQATPDLGVLASSQATTVNRLDQLNGNVFVNTVITGQNGALKIHMKSPSALSLSSGTGGTLATSTDYFYRVEAVDPYGARSFPSEEAWINTASNNAVTITWAEVPGAYYYRIFRTTTSQSYTNTLIAGYVVAKTFTDINYPVTSGTPWSFTNYPGTGAAAMFQMDNAKNFGVMPRTIISNVDNSQTAWSTDFSLRITSPPVGSASGALLQVGAGFTNNSSAGFSGTTYGTQVAIGAAIGFTGSLLDAQTAGISRFRVNFDGSASIGSTAASTSTTTGALVVTGGVGIGGAVTIGRQLTVSETTRFNSSVFNNPSTSSIGASLVQSGYGVFGSYFTGYQVENGYLIYGRQVSGGTIFIVDPLTGAQVGGTSNVFAEALQHFKWGNDKYVALASSGNSVLYSTSPVGAGGSWFYASLPTSASWQKLEYGNDRFIAIATGSTSAYSFDGITWTLSSLPGSYTWSDIKHGNGVFVAGSGSTIAYTYDGIQWAIASNNVNSTFITFGNGLFLANSSSNTASYSRDGINWTNTTLPSDTHRASGYGNGVFINIGNSTTSYYSTDLIRWISGPGGSEGQPIPAPWYINNLFYFKIADGFSKVVTGPTGTLDFSPRYTGEINNVSIGAVTPGAAEFTTLAAQQPVRFLSSTASTDSINGALVVLGGVGIGGTVYQRGSFNSGSLTTPYINQITGIALTGTLTPSTVYYYVVTALDYDGRESLPSAQVSVNTSTNTSVRLQISTIPGARQYRVYRSTTSGAFTNSFIRTTKNDFSAFFYDYGFTPTTGTPPLTNQAFTNKISYNKSVTSGTGNILHGLNIPSGSLSVNTKNDSPLTTVEINGDAAFTRIAPGTTVAANTGGTLTAGTIYYYRHGFVDMRGNESLASDPTPFLATAGGAAQVSWPIEQLQYQVGRIYRSTNIDSWTNTFIGEIAGNNFTDLNYPQLNSSPVTTSSSHSYSYISGSSNVSSLTNLALASGRTNFYKVNGVPVVTASTSTAAGTLSTNTTYYYKAVFHDNLGGTSRFGPEIAISSGVGSAINLSVGIGQNQGAFVFRSTTPNFTSGARFFTTGSITDDGSISNSVSINSNPLAGYQWSLGNAGNLLPFSITVAPPYNSFGLGIAANTPSITTLVNGSVAGTLTTGTTYYYRIVANDAFGQATSSSQIAKYTAPAIGSIFLGFGYSRMGFSSFDVYRSTDPNNFTNTYIGNYRNNYLTDFGYATSSGSPREGANGAKDIYLRGPNNYDINTGFGVISNGFYTRTNIPTFNTGFSVGPNSGTLTTNTDYYYKLRVNFWANNTFGEVSDPIKVNTTTNTAIYLQWTAIEGAQHYSLYRSTDPRNFSNAILINGIKDNFAYDFGHAVATETPAAYYSGSNNVIGDSYGNRLSSLLIMGDNQKLRSTFDAPKFSTYPSSTTGGTLANNTVFFYTIAARGYTGAISLSSSEIRVDTGANNAISLIWLNVNGATGYDIYRSTAINSWTNSLIASNVQSTTFIDINYPTTTGTPNRSNAYGVGYAQSLFENNYNILARTIFGSVNNVDSAFQNFTVRISGNIFRNTSASTLQVGTGFTSTYTFNGSSNGTELAIASGTGFTGSLFDAHSGGTSRFRINFDGSTSIGSSVASTSTATGALVVSGGVGIGQSVIVGGDIIINGGRESNSTSTGSLIVRGGVGITGGLYVKPYSMSTKGLVVQANTSQSGNLFELQSPASSTLTSFNASGELNITSTTGSTSSSFGSIVTAGGVGIGGSLNVNSPSNISSVILNNGNIYGNLIGTATTAGFASTANYSNQSGYATTAGIANTATYANQSGYGLTSGFATTATYAHQSGYAITSGSSNTSGYATTSGLATTSTYSHQSGYAITSDSSGSATTATYAHQSGYGLTSGFASTANYANQSGYGLTSGFATTANYSNQSGYAITSGTAALATTSTYSHQSGYAITSGSSNTSGLATTATYSHQSGYGITAGFATTANYANQSGYATTSGSSGLATTATYAHQSGYAITSGSSNTSGYATTSGLATTATYSYQSGYATTSGLATTATYAHQSGYAITSGSSATATTATYALQSGYAITSGSSATATTSTYSHQSGYAITSGSSGFATTATYAHQSGYAITSASSGFATTATYSYQSGYATTAGSSGLASTATYAHQSGYGLTSGFATTANYSNQSGYGLTSGFATTANYSNQSGYAITSGSSGTANTSTYSHQSGYATTAGFATTANYSNQSGYGLTSGSATTATYAHQSGYGLTSGFATTANYSNQSGYAITSGSSGSATTATNINVVSATTNAIHPVLFTPTTGSASGVALSTASTFVYNPSTDILSVSGLAITSGTASTNTSSGALTILGGVGIGGSINIGGSVNFSSSIFGGVSTSIVPTMTFIGPANDPITLSVLSDNSLSFDGSSGQLFSINNNLSTGWIFSISDISGLPLFRTNADGTVSMGEFGGNVGIGLTNPTYKLQVAGRASIGNTLFVSGNAHFGTEAYHDAYGVYYSPTLTVTDNFAGDTGIQIQNKSNDLNSRSGIQIFNDANDYFSMYLGSSDFGGIGQSFAYIDTFRFLDVNAGDGMLFKTGSGVAIRVVGSGVTIVPVTQSTSTTTGSLVVNGGAGIAKSLNVGGYLSSKPAYATAGLAATQTLTSGTENLILFTKVAPDTDPNVWWTNTAGVGVSHRFKPNIAGLYFVSAQVHFLQGTGSGQMYIQARKNGNTFSLSRAEVVTNANGLTLNLSGTTSLDGNTDYIDFAVFTAGTQNIHGEADRAWSQTTIYKIF